MFTVIKNFGKAIVSAFIINFLPVTVCQCGSYNIFDDIAIDLLPGRMYTVFVSTITSFTDQLPDDMFSTFSVSDQTTTSTGTVAKSFTSSEIAVAATIPSLVALFLLLSLIIVIIVFIYKQQKNHNNSAAEDRAYYSTIGPPLPRDLKTEGNVSYEVVHGEPAKPSDLSSEVQKNVAYGVHVH
ncbi:MAG: hypothetical protein MJE68_26340 [Proteobacteria bacterium]|nr:hypothetical protein [Pseudomonadota bacterium]